MLPLPPLQPFLGGAVPCVPAVRPPDDGPGPLPLLNGATVESWPWIDPPMSEGA